jgi:chaperonin GroEL
MVSRGANSDQDVISIVQGTGSTTPDAENGAGSSVVAGNIHEATTTKFSFNAQTEEYGDMFKRH